MSGRFGELQEAVERNIESVRDSLRALPSASKDSARQINAECLQLGRNVDRDLRAMEGENKKAAPAVRRSQQDIVDQLRRDYLDVSQKLQRVNDTMQRAELMPARSAEVRSRYGAWMPPPLPHLPVPVSPGSRSGCQQDTALLAARDKMVATTGAAAKGTATLTQTRALLAETTDLGISVLDDLGQQRQQIISATGKVCGLRGGRS